MVPKFANGSILPDDGASTIHSAEERAAELIVAFTVTDFPVVTSFIVNANCPPLYAAVAEILSPARTVKELLPMRTIGFG